MLYADLGMRSVHCVMLLVAESTDALYDAGAQGSLPGNSIL